MTIETELFSRLTTFAGLAALVGTRVYPEVLPQKPTLPALVYQLISEARPSAMSVDAGVVRARWQLDGYDEDYDQATGLREQIRQAMQRWRTTSGTIVQDTFILNQSRGFEPEPNVRGLFRVRVDIETNYQE